MTTDYAKVEQEVASEDPEAGEGQEQGETSSACCPSIWCYFAGTMLTQIGQSSMLVLIPLIMIHITGSTTVGAAAASGAAGCAAAGQLAFIPLLMKFDLRTLLLGAMAFKACLLILLSYFYRYGDDYTGTTKTLVSGIILGLCLADATLRGGIDSLRNVIPMIYMGSDQAGLSAFYGKFQLAYNIAMCIGPAFLGLTLNYNRFAATYLVAVVYVLAFFTYWFMPSVLYDKGAVDAGKEGKKKDKGPKKGFFEMCSSSMALLKHPLVLVPFIAGLTAQGQRVKGVLATVFAKGLLQELDGHTSGYIVSAQGAGGIIGAAVATRYAQSCGAQWWYLFGIIGVVARTWGWTLSIPILNETGDTDAAALPFICINFFYGFVNMITINVTNTLLNSRAQSVEIMGLSRFLVRISGVATKVGVTAIVGRAELAHGVHGANYVHIFEEMGLAITAIFIVPSVFCFLHLLCFSGVGHEGNYPPIHPDEEDESATEGQAIELETKTNYGTMSDEAKVSGALASWTTKSPSPKKF